MAINVRDPRVWAKTGKKSYEIWVCMPPEGTKVYNELEDVHYTTSKAKPFVLSGTAGEQWVIDGAKLAKTYTFATGEPITPDSIQRKCKNGSMEWVKVKTVPGQMCNFAVQLPKTAPEFRNFPVKTSWGETLLANRDGIKHGDGDYLVCGMTPDGMPNLADVWVVNGRIFPATYNTKNFQLSAKAKSASAIAAPKPETLSFGGKGQHTNKQFVDRFVETLKANGVAVKGIKHDTVDEKEVANMEADCWKVYLNAGDTEIHLGFSTRPGSRDDLFIEFSGRNGGIDATIPRKTGAALDRTLRYLGKC